MREAIIVTRHGEVLHGTAGPTERVRTLLADRQADEREFIPAGCSEPLFYFAECRVVRLPRRLAYCWSANAIRPRERAFAFYGRSFGAEGHGNF